MKGTDRVCSGTVIRMMRPGALALRRGYVTKAGSAGRKDGFGAPKVLSAPLEGEEM